MAGAQGGWGTSPGLVHGVALQCPDVDGVVHHAAAAAGLAGVLADVGAGHREGVVLADQAHRVGVPARMDQGDVAGDIHAGGAQATQGTGFFRLPRHRWRRMLLIVVPEALEPHQHQLCGVDADGAVRGVHDGLGGVFDPVENADIRLAVQHLPQHLGQLAQADPAGHALAAGLGVAQPRKFRAMSMGHRPGGLEAIRCSTFR